jgi:hypothetical protein
MGSVCAHPGRDRRKRQKSVDTGLESNISKSHRRKVICVGNCGVQMCRHSGVLLAPRGEETSSVKARDCSSTTRMDLPHRTNFSPTSTTSGTCSSRTALGWPRPLQSGMMILLFLQA